MKVRILGCGSSGGVPQVGIGWGACDPMDPKNRRTRCSILISEAGRRLLIDTAPDMREQLLAADVHALNAVCYTHVHADQTHGIDDLRGMAVAMRRRVPVYAEPDMLAQLTDRFDYCFRQVREYPPILDAHGLTGPRDIAGFAVDPIRVRHGAIDATGYRVGRVGYIPDVSNIPEAGLARLADLDLFIVDALRYRAHPSHAHLNRALAWIDRLKPTRAILTNMHHDLDHATLCRTLPDGVAPAFDGMEIDIV